MSGFLRSAAFLAILGFASFVAGRFLPKRWFHYDRFPWKDYALEQRGNLYRRIYIHKWQSHVPDMSRVFKRWMPPKRLSADVTADQVEVMVQETCIAEFVHTLLCIAGLPVLWLWPGPGGVALYLLYAIPGNGAFILIQRFNRPKLRMLMEMLRRRESR